MLHDRCFVPSQEMYKRDIPQEMCGTFCDESNAGSTKPINFLSPGGSSVMVPSELPVASPVQIPPKVQIDTQ